MRGETNLPENIVASGALSYTTHDFWYDLPEELIAQTPLQQRDASRLLALDRDTGKIRHGHFYDIVQYLRPGDCLVMNDSRVLPARLLGHRPTGGAVEVLLLRDMGEKKWECLCKPGRKMQVGNEVIFGNGELTAVVTAGLFCSRIEILAVEIRSRLFCG